MNIKLVNGDSAEELKKIPDNSIDSVVMDPPSYMSKSGFMCKRWDAAKDRQDAINKMSPIFSECLRVIKPGGHALIWALPRTSHYTMCALEDSGWEIRDVVVHISGQGFPKSHNISKALLKKGYDEEAKKYEGFGTAMKPSHECWILCRKPVEGTIAQNVLKYGTGGLNIDGCRIKVNEKLSAGSGKNFWYYNTDGNYEWKQNTSGRFPSHTIFSHHPDCYGGCMEECPVKELGDQSGVGKSSKIKVRNEKSKMPYSGYYGIDKNPISYEDEGTASRFFHCVEECPVKELGDQSGTIKSGKMSSKHTRHTDGSPNGIYNKFNPNHPLTETYGDEGTASRFFHCVEECPVKELDSQAPYVGSLYSAERKKDTSGGTGASYLVEHKKGESNGAYDAPSGASKMFKTIDSKFESFERTGFVYQSKATSRERDMGLVGEDKNLHPTVKSINLMRYLIRLITPKNGIVLDPYMGSGSTGCAALLEGMKFIGIEKEEEYYDIAVSRIKYIEEKNNEK